MPLIFVYLKHMMASPTCGQNIDLLDLFLTLNHTLIDKTSILPGLSGPDLIMTEVNVKPKIIKQAPRNILLHKKLTRIN